MVNRKKKKGGFAENPKVSIYAKERKAIQSMWIGEITKDHKQWTCITSSSIAATSYSRCKCNFQPTPTTYSPLVTLPFSCTLAPLLQSLPANLPFFDATYQCVRQYCSHYLKVAAPYRLHTPPFHIQTFYFTAQ